MSVTQTAFRAALLDPSANVPGGLLDPDGHPAGKRFDVYRNNVVASLAAALEEAFPAARALIGPDNFRALAIAHVRAHPPTSPLMMHMGGDLPAFLEGFAPLARYSWLPDLARLELAVRESYHAADSSPVDASALAGIAPDDLAALRFGLAPALRLVPSRYPIVSLRRSALEGGPAPAPGAQTALVTRPDYDPQVAALSSAEGDFVAALVRGEPLGRAAESGATADPHFTPAAALSALLAGGAIVSLIEGTD